MDVMDRIVNYVGDKQVRMVREAQKGKIESFLVGSRWGRKGWKFGQYLIDYRNLVGKVCRIVRIKFYVMWET